MESGEENHADGKTSLQATMRHFDSYWIVLSHTNAAPHHGTNTVRTHVPLSNAVE
jgi:hypothetical protein